MNTQSLCLLATIGMVLLAGSMLAASMSIESREGRMSDGEPVRSAVRERREAIGYMDDNFHADRHPQGNGSGRGSRSRFYLRWLARQRYNRYRHISNGSNQMARH